MEAMLKVALAFETIAVESAMSTSAKRVVREAAAAIREEVEKVRADEAEPTETE